jgi:hypothetical protein
MFSILSIDYNKNTRNSKKNYYYIFYTPLQKKKILDILLALMNNIFLKNIHNIIGPKIILVTNVKIINNCILPS